MTANQALDLSEDPDLNTALEILASTGQIIINSDLQKMVTEDMDVDVGVLQNEKVTNFQKVCRSTDLLASDPVTMADLTSSTDMELATTTSDLKPGGLDDVVRLNRENVLRVVLGEDLIIIDPELLEN